MNQKNFVCRSENQDSRNVSEKPVASISRKHSHLEYQGSTYLCTAGTHVDCVWNVIAHAQKPDFVFRRNGRIHLNRPGTSVQSTTGSRGVRISGSNAGYIIFRGSVKSTGYPLHSPVSPSLPLPWVTVCHHISTGVYHTKQQQAFLAAVVMDEALASFLTETLKLPLFCFNHLPLKLSAHAKGFISKCRGWLTSRWLSLGAGNEASVFTATVARRPKTASRVPEHVGNRRGRHLLHLRHGFGWPAHPTHCNRRQINFNIITWLVTAPKKMKKKNTRKTWAVRAETVKCYWKTWGRTSIRQRRYTSTHS